MNELSKNINDLTEAAIKYLRQGKNQGVKAVYDVFEVIPSNHIFAMLISNLELYRNV